GRPLLPRLGPVGPPPRLREALPEVGELGFQVADGVLQVAFGRGGGFEAAVGVGHGPFGFPYPLLAAGLALGRGLSRRLGLPWWRRRRGGPESAEARVLRGADQGAEARGHLGVGDGRVEGGGHLLAQRRGRRGQPL